MARSGGFLSGPTGVHGTQKIRKHKLRRGLTRDLNAAAGALVNTKILIVLKRSDIHLHLKVSDPDTENLNPKKAKFGKRGAGRILPRRGR